MRIYGLLVRLERMICKSLRCDGQNVPAWQNAKDKKIVRLQTTLVLQETLWQNPRMIDEQAVKQALDKAKEKFSAEDRYLLKHDCSERSMCHRFAIYLEKAFKKMLKKEFREWSVDCEYNRASCLKHENYQKKVNRLTEDGEYKITNVFPDIIIHKRGNDCNLLVIEAKKKTASESQIKIDRSKLEAYVEVLKYKYSSFITFGVGEIEIEQIQIHNPSPTPLA